MLAGLLVVLLVISILASAWGATCVAGRIVLLSYVFNSRSPHGERFSSKSRYVFIQVFNSLFPCGERLLISFKAPTILSFQFTLLE